MWVRIKGFFNRLSLVQQFMLAGLVILVAGMLATGAWVGQQIEDGVIHRTAATTALYVNSFIAPNLQDLAHGDALTPDHQANLNGLLGETDFGQHIVAFKIWTKQGRVVYSTDRALIGKVFPVQGGLARAIRGEVAARISDLSDAENEFERAGNSRLLEMYSPVRLGGTDQVIGVAEFYYTVADLDTELANAQWRSWLVVGLASLVMYLLLYGFIRKAGNTISNQQAALHDQVSRLTVLLTQNEELSERVRRAAARTTALNERFLRRISADLHDGPAQDIGLALLRLDHVVGPAGDGTGEQAGGAPRVEDGDLEVIGNSLRRAMQEVRAISSGLGLPAMDAWTLGDIVGRVVRAHERRTGTQVEVVLDCPVDQASLPVKITLYRLVQEALSNAYLHAEGRGQRVVVRCDGTDLHVEVTDEGRGFDGTAPPTSEEHLGLIGMRERVESLGGQFQIKSAPGRGTTVVGQLSLAAKGTDER
ncbi:MAG: sensor histidine kinase [Chloroflexia bacterium]